MNVTIEFDQMEKLFGCEVSDEALETAANVREGIAVHYTLQFCTSVDCALLS
jgi:hypothetical protein